MEQIQEFLSQQIFRVETYSFTVSYLLRLIFIYLLIFIFTFIFNRLLLRRIKFLRDLAPEKQKAFTRLFTYVVHIMGLWVALYSINLHPGTPIFVIDDKKTLKISHIIQLLFIYIVTRLIVWFIEKVFVKKVVLKEAEEGKQFAVSQISKYIISILALSIALTTIGIDLGLVWAALAALLVGIGFGLQQTFNDLISGLILLFEGSVKVGDITEIESVAVGKVISIGIRASTIETRDGIIIIVPNSKFVVDNVINWSRTNDATRFMVEVGVAYGSDTELVKEKLLEVAYRQEDVVMQPEEPLVLFKNFGDSSLEFQLHFWTFEVWDIEIVKSKIRFDIDSIFRQNEITIAFPQRDVHVKIEETVLRKIKQYM